MQSLKEDYDKLRKKHSLPSYEEINNEFELLYFGNILEISFPLKFVRRRMIDKVNSFIGLLQNILYPNPSSLINMEEHKSFSEEEKKELSALIQELMALARMSTLLELENDEKRDADFIKTTFTRWKQLTKKLLPFVQKLVEIWKKEQSEEESKPYFG